MPELSEPQENLSSATLFNKKADFDYSPSNWPCESRAIKTRSAVLADYIARCQEGADAAYGRYADSITSIDYGSRVYEKIDIVVPSQAECPGPSTHQSALFAFFHGGYWQAGSYKSDGISVAPFVCNAGHYYAAVGYNDEVQLTLGDITEQAVSAINRLADYANEHNIKSVILSGHSAGAHLVSMAILSSKLNGNARSLVKGVVLLSGVYDIQPLHNTSIDIPGLAILNQSVAQDLSPAILLDTRSIVVENLVFNVISYGEAESDAFKSQSKQFHKLLETRSVPVTLYECVGKDHFNLITDITEQDNPLAKMIVKLLNDSSIQSST